MWLLLKGNGIWNTIITHKYIKNRPLDDWIRSRKFIVNGTSCLWNGFIRILSWITCQLGWKVGNGLKIRLGVDPIAGLDSSYLLPANLRDYLTDFGISNLAQDLNLEGYSKGFNCWYSSTDLNLGGVWDELWSSFTKGLSHGGIKIGNHEDSLLWMFDKTSGMVSAKKTL